MKIVVLLLPFFLFSFSYAQEKKEINVFDTLSKQKFFEDQAHHDMKENYVLDKKGHLKREVSLEADALHYHKYLEDSIYNFLKRAYPGNFKGLIFIAKEDLDWKTGGGGTFSWKKGKKIEPEKLKLIFSSEYEMLQDVKRATWLQKEETGHLLFHNYFLRDTSAKMIYCFNHLSGMADGMIQYDERHNIIYEVAYYDNRKIFYEFNKGKLEIFSPEGNKIFERSLTEITAFKNEEEILWTYSAATKQAKEGSNTVKDFDIEKEYYNKIFALWRENFRK